MIRFLLRGWGYGFAVASRLLFFNLVVLFPAASELEAGEGGTVALGASVLASTALALWASHDSGRIPDNRASGNRASGNRASGNRPALTIGSSLALALSSGTLAFLVGLSATGAGSLSRLAPAAAYALGGAGLVIVNALWETALSQGGIRPAFVTRLGGTIAGSTLFLVSFLLPSALVAALYTVCPLVSGAALLALRSTFSDNEGNAAGEAAPDRPDGGTPLGEVRSAVSAGSPIAAAPVAAIPAADTRLAAALRAAPLGTFAVVLLTYVAFGMARMTVTLGGGSLLFADSPALLPLLTVASVGAAVALVLRMRHLSVARFIEVAMPLVAVAVALPVFGEPFSSGVVSYLLTYVGCEVLFLFAWIPIISAVRAGKCDALFCFALLGLAQWTGSLIGNGICLVTDTYDRGAVIVLLVVVACLLVAIRQSAPRETVILADASSSVEPAGTGPKGPLGTQARCDLLGARCGLSGREMEVCYLWVTGHTAPYIEQTLVISKSTVKTHLAHIYEKTGTRTKEQLIQLVEAEGEAAEAGEKAGEHFER